MGLTKKELDKQRRIEEMSKRECVELPDLYKKDFTEKPSIYCKEDESNSYMTIDSFPRHYLKKKFGLTLQQYYDKWYKRDDEGSCVVCSKQTNFMFGRYNRTCSKKCARKDPEAAKKISDSYKSRDLQKELEKRQNTCKEKFGVDNYAKLEEFNEKRIQGCLDKYGIVKDFSNKEHRSKAVIVLERDKEKINQKRRESWTSEKIQLAKDLREQTLKNVYGDNIINISQTELYKSKLDSINQQCRVKHESSGLWVPLELKSKMEQYYIAVWKETRKHVKDLLEDWDGYDYYTKDKLITNEEYRISHPDKHVNTNPFQPNIEHKISIKHGFLNDIDSIEIGNIKNLAVIGKGVNSSKGSMTEEEYINNKGT